MDVLLGGALVLGGAIALAVAIHLYLRRARLSRTGVAVPATIATWESRTSGSSSARSYYPIAEYTTGDGQTLRHRARYSRSRKATEAMVGTAVTVTYDPQNPASAMIVGVDDGAGRLIAIGLVGAALVVAGAGGAAGAFSFPV